LEKLEEHHRVILVREAGQVGQLVLPMLVRLPMGLQGQQAVLNFRVVVGVEGGPALAIPLLVRLPVQVGAVAVQLIPMLVRVMPELAGQVVMASVS
jgi:hypothetical protein